MSSFRQRKFSSKNIKPPQIQITYSTYNNFRNAEWSVQFLSVTVRSVPKVLFADRFLSTKMSFITADQKSCWENALAYISARFISLVELLHIHCFEQMHVKWPMQNSADILMFRAAVCLRAERLGILLHRSSHILHICRSCCTSYQCQTCSSKVSKPNDKLFFYPGRNDYDQVQSVLGTKAQCSPLFQIRMVILPSTQYSCEAYVVLFA